MDFMASHHLIQSPAARQWENIGVKPHHGIDLPLFSLHSHSSLGIGEYLDLLPMIDWCASLGLDVIQLLPLNDTGMDTSPYNALSAFALNPIHISLQALPYLENYPDLQEELKNLPKEPLSPRLNYLHVRTTKNRFLRHYYEKVKERLIQSDDYKEFLQRSSWLEGYALFKTLKAQQNWHHWEFWPYHLQVLQPDTKQALLEEHQNEIAFHSLLQYLCDHQFQQVSRHAREKGIFLMGDIPILLSRDSADVWLNRELFFLDYSAGSPPDMYSADGQNWGFPVYDWEEMERQGYRWWIDRLKLASRYYQIYRIDHIVGFFRIWAIPIGFSALDGQFMPSDEAAWIDHGKKIMLMMLQHCDMLPIGEDLGVVPPEVRTCLKTLGICGTKVMRWERMWRDDSRFILPQDYPFDSLTTVSTHDSETVQQWWQNNENEARPYAESKGWDYSKPLSLDYHRQILWDSHHTNSLFHVNLLQEYFPLIPNFTWPRLEDERINTPGIQSSDNWTYRFRPSVEELTSHEELRALIKSLIV
jgi:4-alpha-glucanotransferase